MITWTFKRITIGALLFVTASNVCAQNKLAGVIDTNYKNATAVILMEETKDCAVRAIAEAYNVTYRESHAMVKSWGRINNDGVYWKLIEEGIRKDFPLSAGEVINIKNYINSFSFVAQIAENGYTYILIADRHIFVIEQDIHQQWLVKGNYDDAPKQILGYLKIKTNNN